MELHITDSAHKFCNAWYNWDMTSTYAETDAKDSTGWLVSMCCLDLGHDGFHEDEEGGTWASEEGE